MGARADHAGRVFNHRQLAPPNDGEDFMQNRGQTYLMNSEDGANPRRDRFLDASGGRYESRNEILSSSG